MKTEILLAALIVCVVTGTQGCGGPFCVYSQGRCVCNFKRMVAGELPTPPKLHQNKMFKQLTGPKLVSKRQDDDRLPKSGY